MPRLHEWAQRQPEKTAIQMADGSAALSYRELDDRADRAAQYLLDLGLEPGDTVALLLENHPCTFELWWAARRTGLYYLPISVQLTASEVAYILRDSGAKVLLASAQTHRLANQAAALLSATELPHRLLVDGEGPGFTSYQQALNALERAPELPRRPCGREFMYSSGTTGFPKGIRRPLVPFEKRFDLPPLEMQLRAAFRFGQHAVYLSASPLYHAVGRFNIRALECGGTCVIVGKFEAEQVLEAIERYGVTHSHWVPTMLVRMLALPDAVRQRYDVSTMACAIHAAAPCPEPVKRAMIEWWGPVIEEYYGGSENVGVTHIDTPDWLAHPGSVGRPICGQVHIMAETDADAELPSGEIGLIYFEGGVGFTYHNDDGKTRSAFNRHGWGTYGDLGHVDRDGYLYISDRRTDLILSGGVNIYPREVEEVLAAHPMVAEAAVIGVPHAEFGQEVKAVVQLKRPECAGLALEAELIALCRSRLSRIKCPRSVDFVAELPRNENGKLLKRVLRDRYEAKDARSTVR